MQELLDDGLVQFCNLTNTADTGGMPVYTLSEVGEPQSFAEITVGMTRQYLAKGVDEQIDMMIQVWPEAVRPRIGQIAVLTFYEYQEKETGDQYRITNVQRVDSDDGLQFFQLTLQRLEDNYDRNG